MPSSLHEAIVEMLREHPSMLRSLLREQLGELWSPQSQVMTLERAFDQKLPTEYRADLVVVVGPPDDQLLALIVEVQLAPDPDKRLSWPAYATTLRARLRCPTAVVVVCVDESIARFASEPISLGPMNNVFRPIVLGPAQVPEVQDEQQASEAPELAVLSALAHASAQSGLRIAITAARSLHRLDDETARFYYDLVYDALPQAARAALEEAMIQADPEMDTPLVRKCIALGREQGLELGREQGLLRGQRQALRTILSSRGLAVSDELNTAIEACDDTSVLERWIATAVTAATVEDVIAE